jgi:hypothetical protein
MLNESAQAILLEGAQTAERETGESLSDVVASALDSVAPEITSGDTAGEIPENSGAGQVVYTATATDAGPVSWSLEDGGDAAAFSIDADTGAVTLTENPDFETKPSYSFTVVATDAAGNSAAQVVSLSIEDQDDSAPVITSGSTAEAIDENSGPGQVVYDADATDDGPVTWSLADGDDAADFTIDADTGEVTLTEDPDFEAKSSYSFTVVATDADGNSSEQAVSLAINDDDDEDAPSLSSSTPGDDATDVSADSSIVVFDLVQGSSSSHSGRTFEGDVSYDIYIQVDSDSGALSTAGGGLGTWDTWSGSENLGSDDRILLVGDGDHVLGPAGLLSPVNHVPVDQTAVAWETVLGSPAALLQDKTLMRFHQGNTASAALFDTSLPGDFLGGQGGQTNTMHLANMPAGILTSQGLA